MLRLQEKSLDWALKHIESFGDTNIFPSPFEYEAIRYIWEKDTKELPEAKNLKKYLQNQDVLKWLVRDSRKCLVPKHEYGFRLSTQLDPLDTIIYTSLVYEIAHDIEKNRVSKDKDVCFSYRFNPDDSGRMFDPKMNYRAFSDYCSDKVGLLGDESINFVVIADIADFYPRIYSHPLENALSSVTTKTNHVKAIVKLLKDWNYSVSYGIPVGPSASALLAELTINDIDEGLLSEGVDFCRYVDDFRIFCKTRKEAYEQLALLARMLIDNHGLTLQQHKTKIVSVEEFRNEYLKGEESKELDSLSKNFSKIMRDLGLDDPYDFIPYESLPKEYKRMIDSMDLEDALKEQIQLESINVRAVGFLLNRMGQLNNSDILDLVLDNMEQLYSALKFVFKYINTIELNSKQKEAVERKMFDLLNSSIICHLEFHRMWLLKTLVKVGTRDNLQLVKYYNESNDEFSRREIILALSEANHQSWFKSKKMEAMSFSSWQRRTFIRGAICLPGDEAKHWYRSVTPRMDPLEIAVLKWSLNINKKK